MYANKSTVSNNKWNILLVVVIMSFMSCLDSSIVNIALPVMSKDLSASMASIEWVIASYIISICSTLLIFGRLGDMKSKAKVFKIGMILFTLGSFICGISTSLPMLIVSRIIQGIGASAYMANNQGIITQIFNKDERGKALGILASVVALGTMLGAPIGGLIISTLKWNYIFLVNIPIGLIAFIFALKILPNGENNNEKLDKKGSMLFFIATVSLFFSLISAQKIGFKSPIIIISFILAILCILLFIKLEIKIKTPLLQLQIFKNGLFSLSLFCAFISFVCISASIIIIPFYLQYTLKISSTVAGLFMMISPLVITIMSPITGSLSDKIGSELLTFLGLLVISIGFFCMSFLSENSSLIVMGIFIIIIAFGQAMFQPANNSLIMSTVPKDKLGIAGSVNSLTRNLGQIVGMIFSTTLLYTFMSIKANYKVTDYIVDRDDIFIYAMKYVYISLTIVCLIGAILTMIRLYKNKHIQLIK